MLFSINLDRGLVEGSALEENVIADAEIESTVSSVAFCMP
jgi:hypothetical protein